MDTQQWIDKGSSLIVDFGPKVIGAILAWIIGGFIIRLIVKGVRKSLDKSDYGAGLKNFLVNLVSWGLKIILIITVLGVVGIPTASFAAVIAAAGLAIGLALQGSLSNFAGGVLIMVFKPFKEGDLIEAQGQIGVVKDIEIFTTKLIGLSNKEIIIPNGILSNGNILNYSSLGTRRVDLVFGVSYDSDIKQTKEVLMAILTSHPNVLKDPAPTVDVLELADSSVNFAVRPWCKTEDYWKVYFEVTESAKLELEKANIEIPYPHVVEIKKQG